MFHADCARCCAAGNCHFCITAPGKHVVASVEGRRHVAGEEGREYRVCTAHLAWLMSCEYAPAVDEMPMAEVPPAVLARQPDGGTGKRLIEQLNRRDSLELQALLR